jgi:hypothetical protein
MVDAALAIKAALPSTPGAPTTAIKHLAGFAVRGAGLTPGAGLLQ